MFKKKKENNKLKGVAVVAGVASVAAGFAAVALKDKKNQKKARDIVNQAQKKSSDLLETVKNKFKKVEAKKAKVSKSKKKTVVKSASKKTTK